MDNFNWCFIPKPQKIADSNFLGFKDWQQLKSAFFGGHSICQIRCSNPHGDLGEITDSPKCPSCTLTVFTFNFSAFEGSAAQRPKIVKIN
ncbi:MAG: hypothetical protein LBS83_00710 [Holosporales bacterium]|nr:hypothetical protein [Holosporales bacterium]